MKKLKRGSLTVEAALVMSVILVMIFELILLTFHVHNRAWYTAAAGEAVITASTLEPHEKEAGKQAVTEKMAERLNRQGFPLTEVLADAAFGSDYVKVTVNINARKVIGIGGWREEISQREEIIKPVPFIRNIQALEKWEERLK